MGTDKVRYYEASVGYVSRIRAYHIGRQVHLMPLSAINTAYSRKANICHFQFIESRRL